MNEKQRDIKKLPDSELEVMMAVWQGESPVHTGEIMQRLDSSKARRLQSVQIFLGRLVEKGFLSCEKMGRLNYYTPLVAQETYLSLETASFLSRLYGNSPARLMAALVSEKQITKDDLAQIRLLLEEDERKGGEKA